MSEDMPVGHSVYGQPDGSTCGRSHPHEEMDAICERYTYYERELASLRAECDKWKGQIKEWQEANVQLAQRAERAEAERDAALKDADMWREAVVALAEGCCVPLPPSIEQWVRINAKAQQLRDAAIAARKGEQ